VLAGRRNVLRQQILELRIAGRELVEAGEDRLRLGFLVDGMR
jgi:hypothetical protein